MNAAPSRDALVEALLRRLNPYEYPAGAPDVVAETGQQLEGLGQQIEGSLQGEGPLGEFAELIPRWTMANPLKTVGGLMQVREPEVNAMATAAKQALSHPQETASALGESVIEAVKDPMGTAQGMSLTDLTGYGGILSKLGMSMALPGAALKRQARKLKPDESPDVAKADKRKLAEEVLVEQREEVSDLFSFPAKEVKEAAGRREASWPTGSGADGKMRVLSLFDGLGGARVALKNLDAPVEYLASEIDPYAIKVHRNNYPDTKQIGDVSKASSESVGPVDLLVGGSPCQDLSRAKKGGLGLEGPSSALFYDYVRMLKETKPKYFVFENVASMKPEVKDRISEIFGVKPIMIDAKDVSAQNRKRYFWTNIPVDLPRGRDIKIQDVLEKEVDPKYYHTDKAQAYMNRRVRDGRTHLDFGHHTDARSQDKSRTLVANLSKGVPYNVLIDESGRMRKFTPTEVERLAGVPEGYTEGVSNTQRYKMLGNGFQIQVMEHILSGIPKAASTP
tara:strand:- start:159 stop:1676 length:1518 start_codon:yes stop_codon:yes gene_type:complete